MSDLINVISSAIDAVADVDVVVVTGGSLVHKNKTFRSQHHQDAG